MNAEAGVLTGVVMDRLIKNGHVCVRREHKSCHFDPASAFEGKCQYFVLTLYSTGTGFRATLDLLF